MAYSYPSFDYSSFSPFQQAVLEQDPRQLYNYFLYSNGFNSGQQATLAGDYAGIYSDYYSKMLKNPSLSFGSYLQGFNTQDYLSKLSPYARGVDLRQFSQPTHWVTF